MHHTGYQKYQAWQKSDELAYQIYQVTKKFPKDEIFGLTSQLRRAAVSVPTNIAEGMGRQGRNETKQFLGISLGSISEVEYLLYFCHRLKHLTDTEYQSIDSLRQEASNLLFGLYRSFAGTV